MRLAVESSSIMKIASVCAIVAAVATCSSAAEINVQGAQAPMAANTDVGIATKDLMNRATGLLNKNTLAMDNNIFISRSNLVFTQNDRLALRSKVAEVVKKEADMSTADMAKNVMRVVSAPDTDTALMSKANAVVAAKGDADALTKRIADFVDAAAKSEMDREQSIQSQTPRGIVMLIGTKDVLRQPTSVVNKNIALTDNQISITRSQLAPTANDQVMMGTNSKVADAVLPAAVVNVGQVKKEDQYRMQFAYRKEGDQEQFGLWGGGIGGWGGCGLGWSGCGLGWRYPLGYWNSVGWGLYGGSCGLGFPMGGYYYC